MLHYNGIESIIRFGPPVQWTFYHEVTSEEDAHDIQDTDGETDVYIHTITIIIININTDKVPRSEILTAVLLTIPSHLGCYTVLASKITNIQETIVPSKHQ
jgi:hypothetical protein